MQKVIKMNNLFGDAEFWVLIAFIVFIILVGRKAKSTIDISLDKRSNDIKEKITSTENALLEAKKLLKESQHILIEHKKSAEKLIQDQQEVALKNSELYLQNIDKEIERKKASAANEIEFIHTSATLKIQEKISQVSINAIEDLLSSDFKPSQKNNLIEEFIKEIPSALTYLKR